MNKHIELAKSAVESFIKDKKTIRPDKNKHYDLLKERKGVFVSIMSKEGQLRGCIGTYLPTKDNVAEEIIENAISAATRDGRFLKIKEDDLPNLKYSIYLLEKPRPITDISKLNPKKYGILLKTDLKKSALLLPNLPGINSPEEQFSIACQKGGINPDIEKIDIYLFEAKKYE